MMGVGERTSLRIDVGIGFMLKTTRTLAEKYYFCTACEICLANLSLIPPCQAKRKGNLCTDTSLIFIKINHFINNSLHNI